MNFKGIVYKAGQALKAHELGRKPALTGVWNTVEWRTHDKQEIKALAEVCVDEPAIRVYPALLSDPSAVHAVLAEFGLLLLRMAGEKEKDVWRNKLCLPETRQIDSFQANITDPEKRAKFVSYRAIVDSYTAATDRLVALNLTNALQVNNVPFADALGVDIYAWGPTNEYANLKRYHSLVPLTSVYASRTQNENYGAAFADLITENLGSVREKSVAEEMRKLVIRVADAAVVST